MSDNRWRIAFVHSEDRSKVIFTADLPELPPAGTVFSLGWDMPIKYVVVRSYVEVPVVDDEFPPVNQAFTEVRSLSLDTDFPAEFPE